MKFHLIFIQFIYWVSNSDLHFTHNFWFFEGLCLDTVNMSIFLPPDKLGDSQQLDLSLFRHNLLLSITSYPFRQDQFCASGHPQLQHLCLVTCGLFIFLQLIYFLSVQFSFSALHQLEWLSHLQQRPVPCTLCFSV